MRYPQNIPLYEQVAEMIETQIIDGEFRVGDRLPTENNLASDLKVSRTVIREAMKVLKEKGWIETRPGRGTIVIDNVARGVHSSFDVAVRMDPGCGWGYLVEVRRMIEPEIAALAAERASQEQIAQMHQAIESMELAIRTDPVDVDQFLDADFSFHLIMAESTGNPLVPMIIHPVVNLMREQQAFHVSQIDGGGLNSQKNHLSIMAAIDNRDPERARLCMRSHITQVREDIQSAANTLEANILSSIDS
jgi:GntR family transcriptional regulator, transcriptional repressor for pyruvate dehydrogenase complex